jgi:hypothetical protein
VVLELGIEWLGYRFSDVIVGKMPDLVEHVSDVLGYARSVCCVPQGVDEVLLDATHSVDEQFLHTYIPRGKLVTVYAG